MMQSVDGLDSPKKRPQTSTFSAGSPLSSDRQSRPDTGNRTRKIAVLGSGVGAMSAVHELLKSGQKFDITVYQMGWRLGGKGASGRNMKPGFAHRIEEHGLHMWSGLYDNAFRVMQETYRDLKRPQGAPLAGCFDAFKKHSEIVLWEKWRGQWYPWKINVPPTQTVPGEPRARLFLPIWALASQGVDLLVNAAKGDKNGSKKSLMTLIFDFPPFKWLLTLGLWVGLGAGLAAGFLVFWLAAKLKLLRLLQVGVLAVAEFLVNGLWRFARERLDHTGLRRLWMIVNFGYGHLYGLLTNDCLTKGLDFLDEYDYREWLGRYIVDDQVPFSADAGAPPATGQRQTESLTLHSPLMRFLYDAQFSYVDGRLDQPDIAAGSSVKTLLRMAFTSKGSVLWRMQAAMGDVVFAPMYEVMKQKGVRFAFFHRVVSLHLDAEKKSVATIKIRRQAHVKNQSYQPLIDVKGLPCWPAEPLWDQLKDGDSLKKKAVDFESYQDRALADEDDLVLQAGDDFDEIVFGIPLAAIPHVAAEVVQANPRWSDLLKNLKTVRTQAIQVWVKAAAGTLQAPGSDEPLMVTYHATPLNTIADMSFLTEHESWPSGHSPSGGSSYPQAQYYFCGPMLEEAPAEDSQQAYQKVFNQGVHFFRDLAKPIFPGAAPPVGKSQVSDQPAFDDNLFMDLSADSPALIPSLKDPLNVPLKDPWQHLRAQYFRANISPSERFTLTNKGSTRYRIAPGDSGFTNLKLAGDWTQNTFNYANVEATTMSGMLCAQAICGYPKNKDIVGLGFASKGFVHP